MMQHFQPFKRKKGFILLPVVFTLTILAAVAYLLSREGAINAGNVNREQQQDAALYVAKAGYNHAVWQLNRQNCTGYTDIASTPFGDHNYLATFTDATGTTLTAGSPANIKVVGTYANGTSYTINRSREKIYQYPLTTVTLQLGTDQGKDAMIDGLSAIHENHNFGDYMARVSSLSSWLQHQLIQFDLSSIPVEANIVSAHLKLKQTSTVNAGADAEIGVYRINQSWVEGTRTGSGTADGATWNTADGSQNWDGGSGGSYDATLITSTAITTENIVRNWDISMLAQGWHKQHYSNEGLLLKGSGLVIVTFASREDGTVDNRPKLTITYACECGVICTSTGQNLLLVVVDPANLTTQESAKKVLIESWGYTVTLIDVNDSQAEFDAAVANNDVVYVTEDINSGDLGTKLTNAIIGVVTEEDNLSDEFGLAAGIGWDSGTTAINIINNSHYITETLSTGTLTYSSATESLAYLTGSEAPDLQTLANSASGAALVIIAANGSLYSGGSAAGRRVQLPWGANNFDVNTLTTDGLSIMQRAIEWSAGIGADGTP